MPVSSAPELIAPRGDPAPEVRAAVPWRRRGLVLLALALLALFAFEGLWRLDFSRTGARVHSPDGTRVIEVRSMAEDSVLPYAEGVFLRSRRAVLYRWQAEPVFAGRCAQLSIRWVGNDTVSVRCDFVGKQPEVWQTASSDVRIALQFHALGGDAP